MGQKVTIGGNRVGSGKKMKGELNNYFRSTHNLSEKWKTSAGAGILYPSLVKPAMRGDTFDINIDADCRTIPTKGPLFGSFKLQTDVYMCPVRLYQALLHNNPTAIGLKMNEVMLPMITLQDNLTGSGSENFGKMSNSCLLKYLGMSGMGKSTEETAFRDVNAIPALAYYDIYKNYYANKQEEVGHYIGVTSKAIEDTEPIIKLTIIDSKILDLPGSYFKINNTGFTDIFLMGNNLLINGIVLTNPDDEYTLDYLVKQGIALIKFQSNNLLEIAINNIKVKQSYASSDNTNFWISTKTASGATIDECSIIEFPLENIDNMRYDILGHHTLGTPFKIDGIFHSYKPYHALVRNTLNQIPHNRFAMNGLALKTYQNDLFNNWLNTEWIEGNGGINEITAVSTSDGKFTMDALNLAQKLYAMLNRVALAGNTYEDWQDVVYEQTQRRQIESPIYCGGMSQEVVFDEIVQTTPSNAGGTESALGTLGGRGRLLGDKKGGKIHIKCEEACFIIAITSLTPRISYTQGNEFYMTELQSLDDFHKPQLDGIGFQDLLSERLAWWSAHYDGTKWVRSKIGKVPAWIEYMTSVDKAFGDFADEEGKAFMSLNRNYEPDDEFEIADATTYIDPKKYNYAFAYDELTAQNFWLQVNFNITARRLMSARIIPNV